MVNLSNMQNICKGTKNNIYMCQFGTGANLNLLPLAAGQIISRLKTEKELMKKYNLQEIIFRRDDPNAIVSKLQNIAIIGFSCFLWNIEISMQTAAKVREKFPDALIIIGGPAVPSDNELVNDFFEKYPFIDVVGLGEGEEIFTALCKHYSKGIDFGDIPGIVYRNKDTNKIISTGKEEMISVDKLLSPYLDGTFDELYYKYSTEFSGIIWETNRGCPFRCSFCTWGSQTYKKVREKSIDQVKKEIEWIGKNKIKYVAASDANFGMRPRDKEIAKLLALCKQKYGVPEFLSVSWAKNAADKVYAVSNILKKSGIGFRVTMALQSLDEKVGEAINRKNIKSEAYEKIRAKYRKEQIYSYTELILGLPLETYDSLIAGVEQSLSDSVFDQVYLYPAFLFPNTQFSSKKERIMYNMQTRIVEGRYTKSKDNLDVQEFVEMIVGTSTMPMNKWVDSFVIGYYTVALHDDRLAFYILVYLRTNFNIKTTKLVEYIRDVSINNEKYPLIQKTFKRMQNCASLVQNESKSHLIDSEFFGDFPFDPPQAIFLELLVDKNKFYEEFSHLIKQFLKSLNCSVDDNILRDLFNFQNAVMAHPNGEKVKDLELNYNWDEYFGFTFELEKKQLLPKKSKLKVIDKNPSKGDPIKFLKNHFDIRGIPPFNEIYDNEGSRVFPPINLNGKMDDTNRDFELDTSRIPDSEPIVMYPVLI